MMGLVSTPTTIWLLLAGATCLSWLLGHQVSNHRLGSVAVILIAMAKIRCVLLFFMELRYAPLPWRMVFEAWMVILVTVMVMLYSFQ